MAENSTIEWCDHTFNPWIGCTKVGPGCDNCYAEALLDKRLHQVNWGPGQPRKRTSAANWAMPGKWNRYHDTFRAKFGRRQRVFCASLADVFDNAVDINWRLDLFELIRNTPNLDWLLLTKRIGNVESMVPDGWMEIGGWPKHVRLGATIVNQPEANRDIGKLVRLGCPNFLSMEPLLGPVVLPQIFMELLDWVIAGGESGHGARPSHPDWFRSLRDQCAAAGVPFLFKQWGEWTDIDHTPIAWWNALTYKQRIDLPQEFVHGTAMNRVGKKAAGRLLDGRTHDGFPEALV